MARAKKSTETKGAPKKKAPAPTGVVKKTPRDPTKPIGPNNPPVVEADTSWYANFLASYLDCGTITGACKKTGIPKQSVYDARHRDPHFDDALKEADITFTEELESEALRRALAGSDNLLMRMLEARKPFRYGRRMKMQLSFKPGEETEDSLEQILTKGGSA